MNTKAKIRNNLLLISSFETYRAVGQGCFLDVFFFILFIEQISQSIKNEPSGQFCQQIVSWADDITCLKKIEDIERVIRFVQNYCQQSQLTIFLSKNETLSCVDLVSFKSVDQTKIWAVTFYAFDQRDNMIVLLMEQIRK